MPIAPGTRIGNYQIQAPLGSGGMGEVYKATDTRLERTVAIKVLPAHVASDPERKSRFEREAKTLRMGNRAEALGALRRAVELNPANKRQLPLNEVFAALHDAPEFQRLVRE